MDAQVPTYSGGFLYDRARGTVLLHLRDGNTKANPNKWAFFGGTNNGGETPTDCFIREFEEETGHRLPEGATMPLRDYFNEAAKTHRYVFFSETVIATKDIRLDEGAGFGWLRLDQLDAHPLTDMTRNDLRFFQDTLTSRV